MSALDDTIGASDAGASDDVAYWRAQITKAERDAEEWHKRCDKIRKRYLADEKNATGSRRKYQMLWSNQEVLRPAVYARRPNPSVTSRFKDGDPVINLACELLERTLDVQFDLGSYDDTFQLVRNDYLLFARGVPRIRYEAQIDPLEVDDGAGEWEDDAQSDESEEPQEPAEVLKAEHVKVDFVHRKDFIHPVARTWSELPWLCFRAFMDRSELKKRWPDAGGKIPLDAKVGPRRDDEAQKEASAVAKATIYEIWDKRSGKVIWLAKEWPELLEAPAAPYMKFEGFFPCPRPAYGTLDTEKLTSVPDYVYYQDQAEEVNDLTARIASLSDSLKVVGFYPAGPEGEGFPEIEAALRPGFENKAVAVKSWAMFTKAGGSDGVPFVFLPIADIVKTIEACVNLRKQLIDDIWQITGISDIMRGDTEAEETAAAQGMKSIWGSVRLKDKQNEMARICRDVTRMVAEVISGHFQIDTMLQCANMRLPTEADAIQAQMQYEREMQAYMAQRQAPAALPAPQGYAISGPSAPSPPPTLTPSTASPPPPTPSPAPTPSPPPPPTPSPTPPPPPPPPEPPDLGPTQEDVLRVLRDGVLRRFLVDIETDSTVLLDQQAEQNARTELIEKTGRYMLSMQSIAENMPAMLPFLGEIYLFGLRAYPAGRELQEKAEKMIKQLEAASGAPKPPDPKMQLEHMKAQAEISRIRLEQQTALIRAHAEDSKARMELEQAQQTHQMEIARLRGQMAQAQQDHELSKAEHGMKMRSFTQQVELDERKLAATQALDLFKDRMERVRAERAATPPPPAPANTNVPIAPAGPARKRKFAIRRGPDGLAAGFEEVD